MESGLTNHQLSEELDQQRGSRHPAHTAGVLSRDAGDRGAAMHLQGKKRFQIGLDTGAATGITATDREGDRWNHGGSGADVILDQSRPQQPLQSLTPGPTNASAHGLATTKKSFDRHRVAPPATEFRSDRTPSARPSCDQNEQTSCRSANKPWRAQDAVGPMLAAMAAPSARHHNPRPPPRPLAASQPLGSR